MAKLGSSNVRILYDEFDLSGYLNSLGQGINQEIANVRPFNSLAPEKVTDGYDWTWDFGGFGDYDDGLIDEITDRDTSQHYCAWGVGYTAGLVWYFGPAYLASRPLSASTGSAQALSLQLSGDTGLSRGVLLDTRSWTGTATSTGQNLGATSAGTTFAVQVHVISGTFSDLDIEIQESSDDGSGGCLRRLFRDSRRRIYRRRVSTGIRQHRLQRHGSGSK